MIAIGNANVGPTFGRGEGLRTLNGKVAQVREQLLWVSAFELGNNCVQVVEVLWLENVLAFDD